MFNLEFFQYILYFIFIFSIVAYATLDGFDLGVGCLHLLAKTDEERRLMINAIGPVWDGNTTWIVVGGGVLFAAFPRAFALIMSNFYLPVMLLLFAFMLRAASIEFRSKSKKKSWRKTWDFCFFLASLILAFDIGLMLGNLVRGLPLNAQGNFEGGLAELLKPYPVVIALFGISIFLMHGSIYLLMKTEGAFHERMRTWVRNCIIGFLIFYALATVLTVYFNPHMIAPMKRHPGLCAFGFSSLAFIISIPFLIAKRKDGIAFTCSCLSIVSLLILFVIGTFPNIAYSTIDPQHNSLTLFNCSASRTALLVLAIVSLTGVPLSFFYGTYVFKVFRGKVKLDHLSY